MDYILIFFFFIILLVLVIFGLPIGRTSFNDEIIDINKEIVRENFESKAPSTFYDWKNMTNNNFNPEAVYSENETINSEDLYSDNYNYLETDTGSNRDCSKCNASKCKNIDKYVLKSSVPPCPDLSDYILKSEIPPSPDINNYILKSNIPSCPTCPNMSNYIPKNQIPVCPTCPNMSDYILKSKMQVCQKCPKEYKNITDNPKFKEWLAEYEKLIEDKINKNYIRKKECNKVVNQAYKNGEIETFKEIARRFRDRNFLDFLKKKLGQDIKGILEEEMVSGPNRGASYQEEMGSGPNKAASYQEEIGSGPNKGAPYQEEMSSGPNEGSSYQEEMGTGPNNNKNQKNQKNQKNNKNQKNQKNQTSYNTTNMNNIYNKFNTNFDYNYTGVVKNNNNSNFADWNKSSLLLEEEYYKDLPNACNSF